MNAFRRLLRSMFAPAPKTVRRLPARFGMESLETRDVPAAVTAALGSDGVLRVTGTSGNDNIYILQSDGTSERINVGRTMGGSELGSFATKGSGPKATRVEVVGGAGNDTIDLLGTHAAHHLKLSATVYGDSTSYSLTTGGHDTIIGGANHDTIYGGGGFDWIDGQAGIDRLHGGHGNDTLYGASGSDYLYGNEGNDRLEGGMQNDDLYGGTGNDVLLGGGGKDDLFGEADDDVLHGGIDVDTFDGGTGTDTFRRNLYVSGFALSGQAPVEDERWQGDPPVMVAGAFMHDTSTTDSYTAIEQAGSPTCAFLASLAGYARRTSGTGDLVQKIRYDAARDMYAVPLYTNGEWRDQWVTGDWTEGRDPSGPLWVTLYQKAYLQAMNVTSRDGDGRLKVESLWTSPNGNAYQSVAQAMLALTGRGTTYTSNLVQHELDHRSQQTTTGVVASSRDSGTNALVVANHAYVVLSMGAPTAGFADRMVTLYNPWGVDGPNGAITGANDGSITISWAEFVANFEGYTW